MALYRDKLINTEDSIYVSIYGTNTGISNYLKKPETLIGKDTCTPMSTEALSTISKTWKQLKCPLADEEYV